MKTKWMLVKLLLGLIVFIALVSFSAIRHACKPISDYEINIDHSNDLYFVDTDLIKKMVNGKDLKTNQIALGNLDVQKIEGFLNNDPFIKNSEVFKDINGNLKVEVEQEKPVLRINTGKDEFYLSEQLNQVPLSPNYSADVLIVGGNVTQKDYENLVKLNTVLMADKLLKKHIIAVEKIAPNSFNLLVNKGDYIIEFGELNKMEEKFDKLKLFYEQYLGKVGLNYYEKINLKFNNQIVATKRKSDEK